MLNWRDQMKETRDKFRGSADGLKLKAFYDALSDEQIEEFLFEPEVRDFLREQDLGECSDKTDLMSAMEGQEDDVVSGLVKLFES